MCLVPVLNHETLNRLKDEAYRECLQTAGNGVIQLDHSLIIKSMNCEAERICHVVRSAVTGKNALEVFAECGESFLSVFSLKDDEEFQSRQLKLCIHEQGVYVRADTLRLVDGDGSRGEVIVILQDLSAVRAAVRQLQTTQLLVSLGELAAGVAHHVRTPLTVISGYLQIILRRLEEENGQVRRELVENLLGEVSSINGVISELVLFAKPPIHKMSLFDVCELAQEALIEVQPLLETANITLIAEFLPAPGMIKADAKLAVQALGNILRNAIEAMPESGTLQLKCRLHRDIKMAAVIIEDTGSGMAPEMLARVFEPFYTTKHDRMGLGLAVSNRIIGEHGGFVNVIPLPGGGTRVQVYFPLHSREKKTLPGIQQQVLNWQ